MYIVAKTRSGGFYWYQIDAGNGQTLCHSEEYTTKQSALNGIASAKRNSNGSIDDRS